MHTEPHKTANPPSQPTFWEAAIYWLRLGCISFGGPAGQIALMHTDLVERKRWISEKRFLHALNYCMLLPGPEAQQLATYIGWLMHRTRGGLLAGGLFVLPSLALLIGLSWAYMRFGQLPWIAGALYGVKPAVTAIVVSAAWRIGKRSLHNRYLAGIALAAFVGIAIGGLPFPLIVLAAALLAYGMGQWRPPIFNAAAGGAGHGNGTGNGAEALHLPALIDDDTPTPNHARFSTRRFAQTAIAFGVLWSGTLGWLVLREGWDGVATRMAWFFSKAALLTFGGAYAVLPYVHQGAVQQFHWLSAAQMMDGLALGETTPGPLIMVVAFVGFVGGWTTAPWGPESVFLAAAMCAWVATFYTFLPSFAFIFLGGPLIESTHGNLRITAPLAGISAAVVGVIGSLALFFALHVLWPQGLDGAFDFRALAIGCAAAVALIRYKQGVIRVVAITAIIGALLG